MIEKAKKLLKKYYGYTEFRKGQEKTITSILAGNDTFAIMPTGAGKSICYQIPSIILGGVTLVISPLISLMKDQVDSINSIGIKATYINSSLNPREVEQRIFRAYSGEYNLIYIAPERLESETFCRVLHTLDISMVAVDEAHCVSQWGHDFRPSYRYISTFIKRLSKRPIISAFTATATQQVKQDIISLLHLKNPDIYVTGFNRENLFFSVVKGENKRDFILDYIENNKDKAGIIYAATRKEVDNLYEFLFKRDYSVGKYHAGMKEDDRKKNQEKFIYDDINIIIATNAFGMGIDKSNVRYVIHYNMPQNMEAYYQEAGRAGRDGEPGECILLFGAQDVVLQKYLIEQSISSPERMKNQYRKLQTVVDYCHTQRCLRKYILEYFGENDIPDKCENCSTCKDETEFVDITIEAQKIFSCVIRMKQRYGITLIAHVLKGYKNKKVLELGFDNLSTYGLMKQYSEKEIKDMINVLIAEEYMHLTDGMYPTVVLCDKAIFVLKGKEKVFQKIRKKKEKKQVDNSLFQVLRELRKSISEREKVPPYIVFPDSTLREMSEYYPLDRKAMLKIKGVGETKLENYGDEFLQTIKIYVDENNITPLKNLDAAEAAADDIKRQEKIKSHIITYNMYKEGKSLNQISEERDLKIITIQDHIIKCTLEGLDVDIEEFIPEKYKNQIYKTIKEIGAEKLRPIKEALPDEVDYMSIKAALCKIQNDGIA